MRTDHVLAPNKSVIRLTEWFRKMSYKPSSMSMSVKNMKKYTEKK